MFFKKFWDKFPPIVNTPLKLGGIAAVGIIILVLVL